MCLTAVMGAMGLGIDVGVMRYEQRTLQTVADSAAIAGATEIPYGDVATGAANAAALNQFVSGTNSDTLTVNNPPLSGPHSGNAQYVEVIASQEASTYFMKVFGVNTVAVSARAVAYLGNGPACIYALDSSAAGAISLNGSFNLQVGCGVEVNSSSSDALMANGSGTMKASAIGVVGGVLSGSGNFSPTPVTGMVPVNDPLSYLTAPSTSGSCTTPTTINGSGTYVLNHGVYCSTLIINGSPNVTFNSGTYVLDNGIIINGSPTLTGSNITFYNVAGSMTLNGSSSSTLTAPTSGSYAGVLIFQSRSNSSTLTINGSATLALNGAIYAPKATIIDNGSSVDQTYSIFVADKFTVNGSATLHDDYSTQTSGSPIKAAVLVE